MILEKVEVNPNNSKYSFSSTDTALALNISVIAKDGNKFLAQPLLRVVNGMVENIPDTVMAQSLVLRFNQVKDQEKGLLELGVKESNMVLDFVTLKAYEFPFINVLWLGIVIMVVGFVMSIVQRSKRTVLQPVKKAVAEAVE
jgi:cytochrome c-type biogenesis protein CcmF